MTPKEIRLAAGLTIERAAVGAGVTSPTVRLYEASPDAVATPAKRQQLAAYYARLAALLPAASAPPLAPDAA